jgi:hypothetical protein
MLCNGAQGAGRNYPGCWNALALDGIVLRGSAPFVYPQGRQREVFLL